MYTTYCANQPKSIAALERLQARVPAFNDFLAKNMENEQARGLTLFGFLIKPIQRICKYPLLLKDLLKHTDEDHPDYENLRKAQVKIEAVVEYVNERKRLAENLQKILDVQKQIDSSGEVRSPCARLCLNSCPLAVGLTLVAGPSLGRPEQEIRQRREVHGD
jgi:hypothetical protein